MNNRTSMLKTEWRYDSSKQMYYRHGSDCCGAETSMEMQYNGKPTPPNFKLSEKASKDVTVDVYKKLDNGLYKKEKVTKTIHYTKYKDVTFKTVCSECGNYCQPVQEFKYD